MTLSSSLNSALSGLKTYQEALSVHGHNVANANTEGYVKQSVSQSAVVTDGRGQGVRIEGIVAEIDARVNASIRSQNSVLGRTEVLESYLKNAEELYGTPQASNSLSTLFDNFFSSFGELAGNPGLASLRTTTLNASINLTDKINTLANEIQELRLEADREIKTTINTVNNLLSDLHTINGQISQFAEGTGGYTDLALQQNAKIQELGQYLAINVTITSDSTAFISTGNGISLLDSNLFRLNYTNANSTNSFIDDSTLGAVTVTQITGTSGESVELVSSGTSETVTTTLTGGKIKGLLELRDSILPAFVEELDEMATQLRDAVNAIHNDGSSLPPPSSLTGTLAVTANTQVGFSGEVLIAVLNQDGSPATSPYPNETYLKPLTLDLASLNSGSGAGQPTIQTIIDEINSFYGPPPAIATIGNLSNIRVASLSDTIATGSTFNIDFELDNIAVDGSTVEITGLTVNNGGVLGSALPAAYSLDAGATERTNDPVTIDLTGGSGGPYTLTVTVQVTDSDGNVSSADVTYTVATATSGALNDRFEPTSVNNLSGTSSFTASPSSQRFATAKLVDANGNTITNNSTAGFLVIEANGSTNGIAINELNSQETGLTGASSEDITNRGFSHYFGMNNFFEDTYQTRNAAVNFAIRGDIATNPNLIAVGDLTLSAQPSNPAQALYTYELGKGNNSIAQRLGILGQLDVAFDSAGNLPSSTQTLGDYVGSIIASVATRSNQAIQNSELEALILNGFQTLFQESAGVNIDEELAEIVIVENNYRAVARLISVIDELFKELMRSVGG